MLIASSSKKKNVSLLKAKKENVEIEKTESTQKSMVELQKLKSQPKDVSKLSSRLNKSGIIDEIYGQQKVTAIKDPANQLIPSRRVS